MIDIERLLTTDLTGARQTMFSSPMNCGLRLPPPPPPPTLLDPPLKSLVSHFIKRDFLSVYEETKSPAYPQIISKPIQKNKKKQFFFNKVEKFKPIFFTIEINKTNSNYSIKRKREKRKIDLM